MIGSGGILTTLTKMLRSPVRQMLAPAFVSNLGYGRVRTVEQLSPLIPRTRGLHAIHMMLSTTVGNVEGSTASIDWQALEKLSTGNSYGVAGEIGHSQDIDRWLMRDPGGLNEDASGVTMVTM